MNPKAFGIISLVSSIVGAAAAITGTIYNMATAKRQAAITGDAAGKSYAIWQDVINHPEKYKQQEEESSEKEVVPYI